MKRPNKFEADEMESNKKGINRLLLGRSLILIARISLQLIELPKLTNDCLLVGKLCDYTNRGDYCRYCSDSIRHQMNKKYSSNSSLLPSRSDVNY